MLVQPCYPYDQYGSGNEILLLNKLSDGFSTTDQNVSGVSRDVLKTGTAVLAGTERQSLNMLNRINEGFINNDQHVSDVSRDVLKTGNMVLQGAERQALSVLTSVERNGNDSRSAIERNGNDTRMSVERTGHDTRSAVERNASDLATRVERNGGDSRMVTVTTAGDTRTAVGDSRSLIQNTIADAKGYLADSIAATLASVERNSAEGRSTTYEQSAEGRMQNSDNFSAVRDLVAKEAADQTLASSLNFANVQRDVAHIGTANALAAKDIQIQSLQIKSDNLLFAAQNASIARQDTLAGTERLAHRIASSEMEAFKNKELLALQLGRAELEQCRSESRILSKLAECCCEIKEKVDERATVTDLLIKDNETSRLKDELLWARLRRREGYDHGHGHGGHGHHDGDRR
jgi:hypothetical protein